MEDAFDTFFLHVDSYLPQTCKKKLLRMNILKEIKNLQKKHRPHTFTYNLYFGKCVIAGNDPAITKHILSLNKSEENQRTYLFVQYETQYNFANNMYEIWFDECNLVILDDYEWQA